MDDGVVPWEDARRGPLRRYLATFTIALRPLRHVRQVTAGSVSSALWFALASAVPLAMLRGIIPWTEHLLFQPGFRIVVDASLPTQLILEDLLRASGLSLAVCVGLWLALALPYAQLLVGFSERESARRAAWRVMLFGAWLVPIGLEGVLRFGVYWAWPFEGRLPHPLLIMILDLAPLVVLLTWMRVGARQAAGLSVAQTLGALFVPLAMLFLAQVWMAQAIAGWLPTAPEQAPVRDAVVATR